ncbi:MAG: hypothetical protein GX575_09475 [Candidatus Anammoximicrobium sp.]|mgnify:FL=1|nr:hypothetical protein [Candidatus Anammoximicrobium sp.]
MLNRRLRVLRVAAQAIGCLAVFYGYVFWRIRPELFYQQKPHVFVLDLPFFRGFAARPGGIVDCVAAFLSPLLAWDWLGALMVTSLVALICGATRGLGPARAGADREAVCLLPAVLILMVLGQYLHPVSLCVGLGVTLLGANLYARLGTTRVGVRVAAFALGSLVMYFVTAGLYAIFACLCGCHEWQVQRRRWFGAACVACAAGLPYAASWWPFDLILRDAFRGLPLPAVEHWLSIPSSTPQAVAMHTAALTFPLVAAVLSSWRRQPATQAVSSPQDASDGRGTKADESETKTWRVRLAVPAAILLLFVLADLVAFDSAKRCLLEIESASEQRRWDEVLAWAHELPFPDERAFDPRILYCINRALYFKGQLLDRMFAYPQACSTPSLTLIHEDIDTTAHLTPQQCSEIFFDLGRVNESEQMAYEALEQCGNRPEVLKRLAQIYLIKGEPEAARRFLALLARTLLHRGWARQMLQQLDSDPAGPAPWLAAYRQIAVQRDSVGDAGNLERLLQGLLDRNPHNRMALEYLMAHYLLTRQTGKVFDNRHRLNGRDDARYPRHVEEALACHLATAGRKELEDHSKLIGPETWQRFVAFVDAERKSAGDPSAAFAALYPDFHDTYFFSLVFGHNIASLGAARRPE